MNNMERMSEVIALVGAIAPASYNAGAYTSDSFDIAQVQCRQLDIDIYLNAAGVSGKLDFKLQSSLPTGSPSWTDIPGTSITQMATSNTITRLTLELERLWNTLSAAQQKQTLIQGVATVSTNAVTMTVIIKAGNCRISTAADFNLARLTQAVN